MIHPFYIIIILLSFTSDCDQYEFENEDLVVSPWEIQGKDARQMIQYLSDKSQINIDTIIYQNRHVDDSYDTSFTVHTHESKIEIFKTASESWINKTELNDDILRLKNGLHIGSSREELLARFEEIDSMNQHCNSYKITGLAGVSWLDIHLTHDKVTRIYYSGYND